MSLFFSGEVFYGKIHYEKKKRSSPKTIENEILSAAKPFNEKMREQLVWKYAKKEKWHGFRFAVDYFCNGIYAFLKAFL